MKMEAAEDLEAGDVVVAVPAPLPRRLLYWMTFGRYGALERAAPFRSDRDGWPRRNG